MQISLTPALAQGKDKVYAAFVMNFARNVEWPEEKKDGDFIIGIIHYPSLADQLRTVVAAQLKTVHNQRIIIKELSSTSEIDFCHILFIGESETESFTKLIDGLRNKPILLVTEREGLAKKGSCINFLLVDGKLKFEVNNNSFEKHRLKSSDDLRRFGILVQ